MQQEENLNIFHSHVKKNPKKNTTIESNYSLLQTQTHSDALKNKNQIKDSPNQHLLQD